MTVWGRVALGLALLACVLTSIGGVVAPAIAVAVVALAAVSLWGALRPMAAACTLAFLTAAFPKAGVKVEDFPFPVFLLGLTMAVMMLRLRYPVERRTPTAMLVLLVFGGLIASRALMYAGQGLEELAAFFAWTVGPIVLLLLGTNLVGVPVRFRRSLEAGFLVSVLYAFVQFVAGVDAVAIPGLTHALGDDITQKNNVIYSATTENFSKIFSTYQNGNIYGLVAAVFFVMATKRIMERQGSVLDWAVALSAASAVLMSGSRMAIVASAVTIVVVLLARGALGRKFVVVGMLGFVGVVILLAQPGLIARYSVAEIAATGGSGRSTTWGLLTRRFTTNDWLFGQEVRALGEGWIGLVQELGLVGTALLAVTIWALMRHRRGWWPVLIVLGVGAVIDSAYLLFPTWFIPAALMAVNEPAQQDDDPSNAEGEQPEEALQPISYV